MSSIPPSKPVIGVHGLLLRPKDLGLFKLLDGRTVWRNQKVLILREESAQVKLTGSFHF